MSLLAVVLAGVVACGPTEPAAVEWQPPDAYEFVLDSSCGLCKLKGRFHVLVNDGEVVDVEALDEQGKSVASSRLRHDIPTLEDLLAEAMAARQENADRVEVTTDPSDGHPPRVEIDSFEEAVDDEECYTVFHYQPRN